MQNPLNKNHFDQEIDRKNLNDEELGAEPTSYIDQGLTKLVDRLSRSLERDALVQQTTNQLQGLLQVDRVVLYYFYRQWYGQVTFESVSEPKFSIYGSTGPDESFNSEYAAMYEAGRIRAIANIETEHIQECHREFLRSLSIRANLVAPILTPKGLWGLLAAHHCRDVHPWTTVDIEAIKQAAETLATAPAILALG